MEASGGVATGSRPETIYGVVVLPPSKKTTNIWSDYGRLPETLLQEKRIIILSTLLASDDVIYLIPL